MTVGPPPLELDELLLDPDELDVPLLDPPLLEAPVPPDVLGVTPPPLQATNVVNESEQTASAIIFLQLGKVDSRLSMVISVIVIN